MASLTQRPTDKRVLLMGTCLCDAFYDDVARATVEVLEHLGVSVEFPDNQTCCGQPAGHRPFRLVRGDEFPR